ncbi:hypothetical protein SRB5_60780 [Streptomyces sp. RB5]|uniref:Uncharacterized protein n=1 Tax=Streptomyces smaragdinus TaxID=2585196 RepID=A0A7K0CQY3_9ACTN|nr:hypothetical protein [Streptomyces smaragdinus]MQY15886.1 hypothetical protein [Streptomyces smaragdinus]
MGRKDRNRIHDERAAQPAERGESPEERSSASGGSEDKVSNAVNTGGGEGSHKTQHHRTKKFGHN